MTTTITRDQLPPCPLPGCEEGEHHYHDMDCYTVEEGHDCASEKNLGYRCYGPHRPGLPAPLSLPEVTDEIAAVARMAWGLKSSWDTAEDQARRRWRAVAVAVRDALLASLPQWQPIERDQIKAGMRIRVTSAHPDCVTTCTGVAHYADSDGDWCTEDDWLLTGWADPTTCEVDPSTIPDPDAELIEAIGKAIHDADQPGDEWGEDPSAETYRELARAALAAIRESEATA